MALARTVAEAEPGLYTLCYHRVPGRMQENFARQIRFLQKFGRFVSADQAADLVSTGAAAQDRYFLLSFDDGYLDNHDVALPVLTRLGVPAILFLVSDWLDAPPTGADAYMGGAEVRAWLAAGLSIGSHSATHAHLASLGAARADEELRRSQAALSALAGAPVRHFACPWGVAGHDYDPAREPALARACGYRTFFTTRRGHARNGGDLLAMPRHVIEPHWGLYQLEALMGGRRYAARRSA